MATSASWQPPPEVIARGNAARVWETQGTIIQQDGEATQKPVAPATAAFRDWVRAHFPGFSSGGTSRSPAKPSTAGRRRDIHEEGRAVDFMVEHVASAEGEALANWLLANAEAIGVQGIVWNRASWYPERSPRFRFPYTGSSEHRDHVHAELSEGAAARTPELMRAVLDSLPRSLPAESSSSVGGWLALALAAGGAYAGYRWQRGRRR